MKRVVLVMVLIACGSQAVPGKQARHELAAFLLGMDHEPDVFWDRFAGRLAQRTDLSASKLVMEQHKIITIGTSEITVSEQRVSLTELGSRLAETRRALEREIAAGRTPPGFDAAAFQQRIWIAAAPDAPWRSVAEVVAAAAEHGFVQPLFLFDRQPATRPPPRTSIDAEFDAARKRGDAITFLRDATTRLLRNCPDLIAAIQTNDGDSDVAGGVARRLAAALETTTCTFDLPAVRSAFWLTLGNPFPHGVIVVHIRSDAPALALPGNTPWRDANAKLTAEMSVARFVAR